MDARRSGHVFASHMAALNLKGLISQRVSVEKVNCKLAYMILMPQYGSVTDSLSSSFCSTLGRGMYSSRSLYLPLTVPVSGFRAGFSGSWGFGSAVRNDLGDLVSETEMTPLPTLSKSREKVHLNSLVDLDFRLNYLKW